MWTIVFFLPLKNWDILMFARCKVQVIFSNIHVTGVWVTNQKRHISKTAPKGAYGLEGNFDILCKYSLMVPTNQDFFSNFMSTHTDDHPQEEIWPQVREEH
jgi:hypothetical protein